MLLKTPLTENKLPILLAVASGRARTACRQLVRKHSRAAGSAPSQLRQNAIGIHSQRNTAINEAIRNGAQRHEVRAFAGHSDIRTTELYFVRKEEAGELAARRIQIRVARRQGS